MLTLYGSPRNIVPLHKYKHLLQHTHTAKRIEKKLSQSWPGVLEEIKVNKYDRKYQVWKRESSGIELFTENTFM